MHPRIQQVLTHLDSTRASLLTAANEIPESSRDQRPATDRWSVAEVLQHLAMVERRVTGVLKEKLAEARNGGLGTDAESTPLVPTFDWAALNDRSAPLSAPEGAIPERGVTAVKALTELSASRSALRELVIGADGEDLSAVVAPHRRFGPLDAYQWLLFVGWHEGRHADQVREAGALLA